MKPKYLGGSSLTNWFSVKIATPVQSCRLIPKRCCKLFIYFLGKGQPTNTNKRTRTGVNLVTAGGPPGGPPESVCPLALWAGTPAPALPPSAQLVFSRQYRFYSGARAILLPNKRRANANVKGSIIKTHKKFNNSIYE